MRACLSVITIAILILALPFSIFSVHGLGGPLLTAIKGTNIVSVDGTLGATEWADAQHVKFNWAYNNGTFSSTADLWLKNNGTNLEFAFALNGTATLNNGNDYYENHIQLLFDHNNNGVVDDYDSLKSYMVEYFPSGYASQYLARHYNVSYNYYDWNAPMDGTAMMIHNNPGGFGRFIAEFSMPLTSTYGPQDFTLPVNGTIGFELLFQQRHINGFSFVSDGEGCWPAAPPNCKVPNQTSDLPRPQANGWATIVRSNNGAIADSTPPVIGNPTIQPSNPSSNDNVKITSSLTDDFSGVKNGTIYYSTDNWVSVNKTINMILDQTGHTGSGTVPAQPTGTHVSYYLTAYDYSGNKALNNNGTNYFHYDVRSVPPPPPPPSLVVSDPVITPALPGPSDFVNVTVTVSDSQASISQVLLYFSPDNWKTTNWETITPSQSSQVAHGRITNYPSGTLVEYYLVAKDANGNRVTKNNGGNFYSYTVRPQSPPPGPLDQPLVTIPGLPVTITGGFLLLAVPLAIVLSLVVYARRRNKRKPENPTGSA